MDKIRINVEELPELETEVAISGSVKQQEVGGGICLGVAAGIAIYAELAKLVSIEAAAPAARDGLKPAGRRRPDS